MATVGKIPRRVYSATSVYIDDWYKQIVKPRQFYERHSNRKPRRYFYNIDLQGRLFLEEIFPKNITTSIKDEKFLNFFFSRIRHVNEKEFEFLREHDISDDYPFVSKCGAETNFIRPAATPIVFHSLTNQTLLYGGNLTVRFESDRLAISKKSGKFYYRIPDGIGSLKYGLISTSIGVALSNKIIHNENSAQKFLYDNSVEIDWMPSIHEPGSWAMPEEHQSAL